MMFSDSNSLCFLFLFSSVAFSDNLSSAVRVLSESCTTFISYNMLLLKQLAIEEKVTNHYIVNDGVIPWPMLYLLLELELLFLSKLHSRVQNSALRYFTSLFIFVADSKQTIQSTDKLCYVNLLVDSIMKHTSFMDPFIVHHM